MKPKTATVGVPWILCVTLPVFHSALFSELHEWIFNAVFFLLA